MNSSTIHGIMGMTAGVVAILLLGACSQQQEQTIIPQKAERIISLAPSITETVFAIGAGERLVGNTDWCNYPEAAKAIPRVGGYMTLNSEHALMVNPDAIVLLAEHAHLRSKATELGIGVITLENKTVADILNSISTLGNVLGHKEEATRLIEQLNARMENIREKNSGRQKPRVLITVGRNMGCEGIDSVCCVGRPPFHNELVEMAGGENACTLPLPYPRISAEGLLKMDPDIIIDLLDSHATSNDIEKARAEWIKNDKLRAVQTDRIHVLAGDYTVVPGPRFILLLEHFADIIQNTAAGTL